MGKRENSHSEKITRENLSHKGILHAHGFSHRLGLSKKDRTVSEAKEIDKSKQGDDRSCSAP